jgi:type IV fimbrial biogenesis protein FimT
MVHTGFSFLSSFPFVCQKIPFIKPFVINLHPFINSHINYKGFSLVELIITLTIAGILIAAATPALRNFIFDQRLTSQANDFIADLNFARSEAIKRATNVSVCKQGGSLSSPLCNPSANWHAGRIVFVDSDGDSTIDGGETILRVRESLEGNNTLNVVGGLTLNSIVIASTGMTTLATGQETALRLCDSRGTVAMTVSINYTGRAISSRSTVTSCP